MRVVEGIAGGMIGGVLLLWVVRSIADEILKKISKERVGGSVQRFNNNIRKKGIWKLK